MNLTRYILFFLCFCGFQLKAQLIVNTTIPPVTLVENYLSGDGVQITNPIYTGVQSASGVFQNVSSNLPLANGLIISTGSAANAAGANLSTDLSTNNAAQGDADLESLVTGGNPTFDAAVLEFDVVSVNDSIYMDFLFASEDYDERIGTGQADAFGIFISGPGFNGLQNVGFVPGTSIPISSTSVNSSSNSNFFVDNTGGLTVSYDGFTKKISASAKVQPCQVYHIKIVIADVGDELYDSALMFLTSSLKSGSSEPTICSVTGYFSSSPIDCGVDLGSISLDSVVGGISPYTFTINGQSVSNFPVTDLAPGDYTVVVTDNVGVAYSETIQITDPACSINANFNPVNSVCQEICDGSLDISDINGGFGPYTIKLNGNLVSLPINNLCPNNYSVTIMDAIGSNLSYDFTISTQSTLNATLNNVGVVCTGDEFPVVIDMDDDNDATLVLWNIVPTDSIDLFNYIHTAQPGVDYMVEIWDALGCRLQLHVPVSVQEFGFLDGMVYLNGSNSFLNAGDTLEVSMLKKALQTQYQWEVAEKQYFTQSDLVYYFSFDSINAADYALVAKILNSSYGQSVLPTYSGDKHLWSQATITTIISNVCNLHSMDINLVNSIGEDEGTGGLSGVISVADFFSKTHTNNDPIPLIDVVVEKDSLPVRGIIAYENPLGSNQFPYQFDNLPTGSYKVRVQIPGIPMVNNYSQQTTALVVAGQIITDINFCADWFELGIIDTASCVPVGFESEALSEKDKILIKPNPSDGVFLIQSTDEPTDYEVLDIAGQIILNGKFSNNSEILNLSFFSEGIYFLRTKFKNGDVIVRKLIKAN